MLATLALSACADFEGTADPTVGLPDVAVSSPSFVRDVRPILVARCALGGCHTVLSRQANLVLVADSAYDALVNRPARLSPAMVRVKPGSANESWLVAMIGPDDAKRPVTARMPLASTPLTVNQITTIVRWIDGGAPRN